MLRIETSLRMMLGTSMVDCRVLGNFLDWRAEREYEWLEGDGVVCERGTSSVGKFARRSRCPGFGSFTGYSEGGLNRVVRLLGVFWPMWARLRTL